jgi:hypothetical protein
MWVCQRCELHKDKPIKDDVEKCPRCGFPKPESVAPSRILKAEKVEVVAE